MREDGLAVSDLELGIQGGIDVLGEDALKGLDEFLQVLGRKLGIDANAGDQAGLDVYKRQAVESITCRPRTRTS